MENLLSSSFSDDGRRPEDRFEIELSVNGDERPAWRCHGTAYALMRPRWLAYNEHQTRANEAESNLHWTVRGGRGRGGSRTMMEEDKMWFFTQRHLSLFSFGLTRFGVRRIYLFCYHRLFTSFIMQRNWSWTAASPAATQCSDSA